MSLVGSASGSSKLSRKKRLYNELSAIRTINKQSLNLSSQGYHGFDLVYSIVMPNRLFI